MGLLHIGVIKGYTKSLDYDSDGRGIRKQQLDLPPLNLEPQTLNP